MILCHVTTCFYYHEALYLCEKCKIVQIKTSYLWFYHSLFGILTTSYSINFYLDDITVLRTAPSLFPFVIFIFVTYINQVTRQITVICKIGLNLSRQIITHSMHLFRICYGFKVDGFRAPLRVFTMLVVKPDAKTGSHKPYPYTFYTKKHSRIIWRSNINEERITQVQRKMENQIQA
jgi:hypothetical protein